MKVIFTEASWTDYLWFQENDRKLLNRINNLIKEIKRNPFAGIGKPEPLRANLRGYSGLGELTQNTGSYMKFQKIN